MSVDAHNLKASIVHFSFIKKILGTMLIQKSKKAIITREVYEQKITVMVYLRK